MKLFLVICASAVVLVAGRGPLRVPLNPPHGQVLSLDTYNVDPSTISVSGFSAGGGMAIQYHVAHSASIVGVGIFAGIIYACGVDHTFEECLWEPEVVDVQGLIDQTETYATAGLIDATSNMAGDNIYIYTGTKDKTVVPAFAQMIYEYYSAYADTANILFKNDIPSRHGYPHENRGLQCNRLDWKTEVSVNNCKYDGAFNSLNQIYGDLQKPDWSTTIDLPGDFHQFDQTEFYDAADPGNEAWDAIGYVYIPSGCVDKQTQCRLHVHYHGCTMGRYWIGDEYIVRNGVLEVAELNNIIVIYPQVGNSADNPIGCWDIYGYSSPEFATKNGHQIAGTERMIKRVAGL